MAKRSERQEAIGLLAAAFEGVLNDDLIVERRTWKTLLRLPKLTIQKELRRLKIPETRVGRCILGLLNDGEEQVAAVWTLDKKGKEDLLLLGDQEQMIGTYRPGSL